MVSANARDWHSLPWCKIFLLKCWVRFWFRFIGIQWGQMSVGTKMVFSEVVMPSSCALRSAISVDSLDSDLVIECRDMYTAHMKLKDRKKGEKNNCTTEMKRKKHWFLRQLDIITQAVAAFYYMWKKAPTYITAAQRDPIFIMSKWIIKAMTR